MWECRLQGTQIRSELPTTAEALGLRINKDEDCLRLGLGCFGLAARAGSGLSQPPTKVQLELWQDYANVVTTCGNAWSSHKFVLVSLP